MDKEQRRERKCRVPESPPPATIRRTQRARSLNNSMDVLPPSSAPSTPITTKRRCSRRKTISASDAEDFSPGDEIYAPTVRRTQRQRKRHNTTDTEFDVATAITPTAAPRRRRTAKVRCLDDRTEPATSRRRRNGGSSRNRDLGGRRSRHPPPSAIDLIKNHQLFEGKRSDDEDAPHNEDSNGFNAEAQKEDSNDSIMYEEDSTTKEQKKIPKHMRHRYWTFWEEMRLIELWRLNKSDVTTFDRNGPVFRSISDGMKEKGMLVNAQECRRKLSTLNNKYRNEHRRTVENAKDYPKSDWRLYSLIHCVHYPKNKNQDVNHQRKIINRLLERIPPEYKTAAATAPASSSTPTTAAAAEKINSNDVVNPNQLTTTTTAASPTKATKQQQQQKQQQIEEFKHPSCLNLQKLRQARHSITNDYNVSSSSTNAQDEAAAADALASSIVNDFKTMSAHDYILKYRRVAGFDAEEDKNADIFEQSTDGIFFCRVPHDADAATIRNKARNDAAAAAAAVPTATLIKRQFNAKGLIQLKHNNIIMEETNIQHETLLKNEQYQMTQFEQFITNWKINCIQLSELSSNANND